MKNTLCFDLEISKAKFDEFINNIEEVKWMNEAIERNQEQIKKIDEARGELSIEEFAAINAKTVYPECKTQRDWMKKKDREKGLIKHYYERFTNIAHSKKIKQDIIDALNKGND